MAFTTTSTDSFFAEGQFNLLFKLLNDNVTKSNECIVEAILPNYPLSPTVQRAFSRRAYPISPSLVNKLFSISQERKIIQLCQESTTYNLFIEAITTAFKSKVIQFNGESFNNPTFSQSFDRSTFLKKTEELETSLKSSHKLIHNVYRRATVSLLFKALQISFTLMFALGVITQNRNIALNALKYGLIILSYHLLHAHYFDRNQANQIALEGRVKFPWNSACLFPRLPGESS